MNKNIAASVIGMVVCFMLGWFSRGDHIYSGMFERTVGTVQELPVGKK